MNEEKEGVKESGFIENAVDFIYKIYEFIVALDYPLSLLAIIILPFIAPILPATYTGDNLQKYLRVDSTQAFFGVVAFVLIGYAGIIAYVRAKMKKVKAIETAKVKLSNKKDEKKKITKELLYATNPEIKEYEIEEQRSLFAYGMYLLSLLASNALLEWKAGVSWDRIVTIVLLTVGLELAAGMLNAGRIYERDEKDESEKLRQERREDRRHLRELKYGKKAYASETGVNGALDAPLSDKDKRQIARFQKELFVTGNWRKDGKKMNKSDLEWLSRAETFAIKLAIGGANTPDKTAQNWRNYAKASLDGKR